MDQKLTIVENSLDLFIKKGCKSVTMDDVARENGISKRTLYEIFKDKTDLLEECLRYMYSQMEEQLNSTKGKTGNVIETLFTLHNGHTDVLFNLRKNFFEGLKRYYYPLYKKSVNYFIDFHQKVTFDFLQRGKEEGLIKSEINIEIVTKILIELGHIMENSNIFSLEEYSRSELFLEVTVPFIRGLCTEEGIRIVDINLEKRFK
jgi:TetR/AcrR family transcriptional regulator, cholesterol catabolism regulator